MKYGVCGGGAATWNRNTIGCVNARNKGTCDNKRTIKREDVEALVLDGLENTCSTRSAPSCFASTTPAP